MKRLIFLLVSFSLVPAAALEIHPLNVFKLFTGKHERARVNMYDPVFRSRRVPLMDVRSCGTPGACVVLNGRRMELEPVSADLLHQRVQLVGRLRGPAYTGVFARVRFSPWGAAQPDYLLIWASVRNKDRIVKIQGYSIDRDEEPGTEYAVGPEVGNFNLMKYLTSKNVFETEVARELTFRQIFCLKSPAEPLDTIRDEVSPLQHANLINTPEAQTRLTALQSVASVIDEARGRLMCDSPLTDQVDGVLDRVREALQIYVRKTPAPTVTPRAPREIPRFDAPRPIAPPAPKTS